MIEIYKVRNLNSNVSDRHILDLTSKFSVMTSVANKKKDLIRVF